jgi:hypothetical protein
VRAVQVAVRADVRQAALHAPVAVDQTGTETQCLLVAVVAARTEVQLKCCSLFSTKADDSDNNA